MAVTWTVEVDADPNTIGKFVLDASLLGGSDVLTPDENWVALDATRIMAASIRRGSSGGTGNYDAGELTLTMDNTTGDFDPDNPYGKYTMGPLRLLHQGTGIRVKANATVDATLFAGKIEKSQIGGDYFLPTATITAVDALAALGNVDVPDQGDATGTGDPSSTRAHWLLSQARIPLSKRNVESGGRLCLGTTGGGTVRDALQRVAVGEGGRFFVSRDGLVTLTWHDAEYGKTALIAYDDRATGAPRFESIQIAPGSDGLINASQVHRVPPKVRDPVTGQYTDGPELPIAGDIDYVSVERYGQQDVKVDVVLQSDADAASLATYLAYRRSTPAPRLAQLVSVPLEAMTAAQAQAVLTVDLGSLITVVAHTIDGRALTFVANVEGIQFDKDSPMTRVTFVTSPSDNYSVFGTAGWFKVGTSLLGGVDVLAAY